MFENRRILFPVDFSARARAVIPQVEAFAGRFDAEIVLLHVTEPPAATKIEAAEFERFLGADLKYLRTRRLVEQGEAASKIVEVARRCHVDIIMMPTLGLGTFRRYLLGSTASKVLHDSDWPVWTSAHLEEPVTHGAVRFRRILCAVDLEPSSREILEWAREIAEEYQADLTLAHVTADVASQALARENLESLKAAVRVNATLAIDHGQPSKIVAKLAEQTSADLLVIGRRPARGAFGRLEETAYGIIRQSPCPVVSV